MTRQFLMQVVKGTIAMAVTIFFWATMVTAQSITTTGGVLVSPTNTATSAAYFSSGSISLSASVWEPANSTASSLKQTITNIVTSKTNTMLLFEVDPGTIADPWNTNNTVRFKGVNTGLEVINTNDNGGIRFMASYNKVLFGPLNTMGSSHGVVGANDWSMTFATDYAGAVGSLIPWRTGGPPTYRNLLDDGAGNMGLGIGTPTAQLHTSGSVRFAGITNNNTTDRIVSMDANNNLYYRDAASLGGGSWSSNAGNIYNANTGLVVIGSLPTTLPIGDNVKLAVNGSIYAQKLKVTANGWADYVFDPTYKLRTLKDVEIFIKKNNHLPEIPSAAEVEKQGIDVGGSQAVLLKKVEELTLYIIDLNKRIETLEKEKKISTATKQHSNKHK